MKRPGGVPTRSPQARVARPWKGLLVALLAAVSAAGALAQAPAAQKDYPAEQIDAYVALIQADQARDRGNWKTAVQQYREAMKQYALLVEKNPTWNPEIVQFRLSYCANEVQAIVKKTGKTEAELLAGPAITAEDENASYKERFDALKREHEKVREEAAQLRKDGAMNEAVAKNLQLEAKRLEKDNNRLRLDLTASANLANRNAAEVEERKQDIAALRTKLDEMQAQILKAEREKQAAERAKAEAEQTGVELSKSLADTRRMGSEAEGRAGAVIQQLDEAKKSLADHQQRLAVTSNELAKAAAANEKLAAEIKSTGKVDAEKFKRQYELARIESDLLARKLVAKETESDARGEQLAGLARERKSLTNDLAAAKAAAAATVQQLDAAKAQLERQQKAVELAAEATNTAARQKTAIAKLEQSLEAAEKAADDAKALAGSAPKIQARLDEAGRQLAAQKALAEQAQKDLALARDLADANARDAKKLRLANDELLAAKAQAERDARLSADAVAKLSKENRDLADRTKGGDAASKAAAAAAEDLKKTRDQLVASQNEVMALRQQLAAATTRAPATDADKLRKDLAAAQGEITQLKQQLATAGPGGAGAPTAGDAEQLRRELAAARDEAKTWASRQEAMSNSLDGVKKRLAELNQELLVRDRKAQADGQELAQVKKDLAADKAALAAAQQRAADFEEQNRALSASRMGELEKLKKHAAALSETIDLNQKEMERLRGEASGAKARLEQLENDHRLLQNENARLKK